MSSTTADLAAGRLPDMAALRARFAPDPASLPDIAVPLASLDTYDDLLHSGATGDAA